MLGIDVNKIGKNTRVMPPNLTVGHMRCPFVGKLMSLASRGHLCKHPVDLTLHPHCHYANSCLIKVVKYFYYTEAILRPTFRTPIGVLNN